MMARNEERHQRSNKWNKVKRNFVGHIEDFFGVGENSPVDSERWQRRRYLNKERFGMLKDEYKTFITPSVDQPDSLEHDLTEISSSELSHREMMLRKPSVLHLTAHSLLSSLNRVRNKPGTHETIRGTQSFPKGSLRAGQVPPSGSTAVSDEVFFTETPRNEERRVRTRVTPETASGSDEVDSGPGKITKDVLNFITSKPHKRDIGRGFLGRIFNRDFKSVRRKSSVKKQIEKLDNHRPYFTYWMTFVQVIVMIVSVSVYGFAKPGFTTASYKAKILQPNLVIINEEHIEPSNFWLGNRQADLIHLGAKYSPCMRRDQNIEKALTVNRDMENRTGCCILTGGSGCFQTLEKHCFANLANFRKGKVCGLDPEACSNPESSGAFRWGDEDIVKWPVCKKERRSDLPQMNCELTGHPCCFGIQGACIVTTREQCDFRRGYYHINKTLCSQVSCLSEICGMIPFSNPQTPDQFYRLWISLFLHGGFIHLLFTVAFQFLVMRDLEKLAGAIRVCIIYFGSGIAGSLASSIFLPYQVEVGPAGAQFGILACLVVEILQSWQMIKRPWRALGIVGGIVLFLFLLGFLPWIDNYAHLFGFIFGILLAFAFLPYVTFGVFDRRRKIIGIIICLVVAVGLFILLILLFYITPIYSCKSCSYFNCIPFTDEFCKNHDIAIISTVTYDGLKKIPYE